MGGGGGVGYREGGVRYKRGASPSVAEQRHSFGSAIMTWDSLGHCGGIRFGNRVLSHWASQPWSFSFKASLTEFRNGDGLRKWEGALFWFLGTIREWGGGGGACPLRPVRDIALWRARWLEDWRQRQSVEPIDFSHRVPRYLRCLGIERLDSPAPWRGRHPG